MKFAGSQLSAAGGAVSPSTEPDGASGDDAPAEADFYMIDGVSFSLDGECSRDAADTLLASFDALPDDEDFSIMGLPVLEFTAEAGGSATFGIRALAPGLIAETFDGTTASFQEDFAVVIGDGEITGGGTYLDYTPDKQYVPREIAFHVACATAGQAVDGPDAAALDVCTALDGIALPDLPASYGQEWDAGRDAGWVDSTLGVEIASCSWHAESDDGIEDVVQVTFLPDGHEWAEPAYYEHPEASAVGYTLETVDGAFVWLFPGGPVNTVYLPVEGGVVSVGSTYPTFEMEPFLAFAREAMTGVEVAR